jgi:hypothetical protein
VVDVLALGLERHDLVAELAQRLGRLGRAAVVRRIEFEDFADVGQAEANPLALQDQGQAGAVAIIVDPVQSLARRREQPLVLIETQRSRRHFEFDTQLADGVGALRAPQVGHGFASVARSLLGHAYVNVKLN